MSKLWHNNTLRALIFFSIMAFMLALVGMNQSWSVAIAILNLCIISAIMSLGLNLQWGYAGLFNVGIMGFTALGGIAAVLVSYPPVKEAWQVGGLGVLGSLVILLVTIAVCVTLYRKLQSSSYRWLVLSLIILVGYFLLRLVYEPAVKAIEATDPSRSGFLGGLGLPSLLSWLVGGLFAAGAAWFIGKIALGLKSDYLAIATLGIAEIVVSVLRNEDWLSRGVKNVTGVPRPVPYEIELQQSPRFIEWVSNWNSDKLAALDEVARNDALQKLVSDASSIAVKLSYTGLFTAVLLLILLLSVLALHSPWGRMVRAIRDNEVAASAMGKDVKGRHLQIFVLGSAVFGIAGAMLVTLDGQFTPGAYSPLRYTFLVWVMVMVGGSGNNLGAVLGGFVVWFLWVEAEPAGFWLMNTITSGLDDGNALRTHLINNAQYMRVIVMGLVLLLVMRFSPWGLLPEQNGQRR